MFVYKFEQNLHEIVIMNNLFLIFFQLFYIPVDAVKLHNEAFHNHYHICHCLVHNQVDLERIVC